MDIEINRYRNSYDELPDSYKIKGFEICCFGDKKEINLNLVAEKIDIEGNKRNEISIVYMEAREGDTLFKLIDLFEKEIWGGKEEDDN